MHRPSSPPNRSDGSTAITANQRSGGHPPPTGAAGASAQTSRSDSGGKRSFGHPDSTGGGGPDTPSLCKTKPLSPLDGRCVHQTRSIFNLPRRESSGYFSFDGDSLPSTPLSPRPVTADRATQTASPIGQVITHAVERLAEAHGGGPGTHQQHGPSPSPSSTRPRNAEGDMQAQEVGQRLRRFGDIYNDRMLRRQRDEIHPIQQPHIHQEPTVLLCVGLLLLLIGRIIYLQGGAINQDHSQV